MKSTEKDKDHDDGKAANAGPAAPPADEHLVKLKKQDEGEITVHPSCVEAHLRKGWKVA